MKSVLNSLFCGAITFFAATCALAQSVPAIDEVISQARARREKLSGIRIRMNTIQNAPIGQPAPAFSKIERELSLDMTDGRYSVNRQAQLASGGEIQQAAFAFDGEIYNAHSPANKIGFVDDSPNLNIEGELGLLAAMMVNPPSDGGLGIDDGSLESFLINSTLRTDIEHVNSRACYVAEARMNGTLYSIVWLDIDRDLLPIRKVTFGPDGRISAEGNIEDAIRTSSSNGVDAWVPLQWVYTLNVRGHSYRVATSAEASDVEINPPFESNQFRISFPPGTRVQDRVSHAAYIVSDDGSWLEQSGDEPHTPNQAATRGTSDLSDRSVNAITPDRSVPSTQGIAPPAQSGNAPTAHPPVVTTATQTGVRDNARATPKEANVVAINAPGTSGTSANHHPIPKPDGDEGVTAADSGQVRHLFLFIPLGIAALVAFALSVLRRSRTGAR
ncbi:MAG: hypothetical protein JNG88_14860 [Phycisphaerales bacterium]|nr:hypothetical protein [Phycisphaerales bacterium]